MFNKKFLVYLGYFRAISYIGHNSDDFILNSIFNTGIHFFGFDYLLGKGLFLGFLNYFYYRVV